MSDELDSLGKGAGPVAGVIVAAVLALVTFLPKLRNAVKTDQLDGDVLTRLAKMEKHAALQDRKSLQQDRKIHRYSIKLTRLVVVVIRLEALLVANTVRIPVDLAEEIAGLKHGDGDDEQERDTEEDKHG